MNRTTFHTKNIQYFIVYVFHFFSKKQNQDPICVSFYISRTHPQHVICKASQNTTSTCIACKYLSKKEYDSGFTLVLSLSVLNWSSSSVFLLSYSIPTSIVRKNITQNNENFTYHEIIHLMSCYSKIIWKEIKMNQI